MSNAKQKDLSPQQVEVVKAGIVMTGAFVVIGGTAVVAANIDHIASTLGVTP